MTSISPTGPILVTGATGQHGGTSAHVVKSLIEAGKQVRILARSESKRTAWLSALGAEIVFGDFNDRKSLIAALDGVSLATFTYPIAPGIVQAAATFASASKEIGSPLRVVMMSMAVAHPKSPSHLARAQWLAEEVLAWSGLDLTILRVAALFYENISSLHGHSIRERSRFGNSFGTANVPWISGLDAARLVVAALLKPDSFSAAAIHYPPGAELLSHHVMAGLIAAELGRSIEFHVLSRDDWKEELLDEARRQAGGVVNADMAAHISAVGAALAENAGGSIRAPDPRELERLTGFEPQSFTQYIALNRNHFLSQP